MSQEGLRTCVSCGPRGPRRTALRRRACAWAATLRAVDGINFFLETGGGCTVGPPHASSSVRRLPASPSESALRIGAGSGTRPGAQKRPAGLA